MLGLFGNPDDKDATTKRTRRTTTTIITTTKSSSKRRGQQQHAKRGGLLASLTNHPQPRDKSHPRLPNEEGDSLLQLSSLSSKPRHNRKPQKQQTSSASEVVDSLSDLSTTKTTKTNARKADDTVSRVGNHSARSQNSNRRNTKHQERQPDTLSSSLGRLCLQDDGAQGTLSDASVTDSLATTTTTTTTSRRHNKSSRQTGLGKLFLTENTATTSCHDPPSPFTDLSRGLGGFVRAAHEFRDEPTAPSPRRASEPLRDGPSSLADTPCVAAHARPSSAPFATDSPSNITSQPRTTTTGSDGSTPQADEPVATVHVPDDFDDDDDDLQVLTRESSALLSSFDRAAVSTTSRTTGPVTLDNNDDDAHKVPTVTKVRSTSPTGESRQHSLVDLNSTGTDEETLSHHMSTQVRNVSLRCSQSGNKSEVDDDDSVRSPCIVNTDVVQQDQDAASLVPTTTIRVGRDATPSLPLPTANLSCSDESTPLKPPRKRQPLANHTEPLSATPSVQMAKRRDQKKTPIRPDASGIWDGSAGCNTSLHADHDLTPPKSQQPSRKRVVVLSPYARPNQASTPTVPVCKRRDQKKTPARPPMAILPASSQGDSDPPYVNAMTTTSQTQEEEEITPVKPQPPGIVLGAGNQPPGRHVDESLLSRNDTPRNDDCADDDAVASHQQRRVEADILHAASTGYQKGNREVTDISVVNKADALVGTDLNTSRFEDANDEDSSRADHDVAQFDDADDDDIDVDVNFCVDKSSLAQKDCMATQCALSLAEQLVITEKVPSSSPPRNGVFPQIAAVPVRRQHPAAPNRVVMSPIRTGFLEHKQEDPRPRVSPQRATVPVRCQPSAAQNPVVMSPILAGTEHHKVDRDVDTNPSGDVSRNSTPPNSAFSLNGAVATLSSVVPDRSSQVDSPESGRFEDTASFSTEKPCEEIRFVADESDCALSSFGTSRTYRSSTRRETNSDDRRALDVPKHSSSDPTSVDGDTGKKLFDGASSFVNEAFEESVVPNKYESSSAPIGSPDETSQNSDRSEMDDTPRAEPTGARPTGAADDVSRLEACEEIVDEDALLHVTTDRKRTEKVIDGNEDGEGASACSITNDQKEKNCPSGRPRRQRAQPSRLGRFASEHELDRRLNKKKKKKGVNIAEKCSYAPSKELSKTQPSATIDRTSKSEEKSASEKLSKKAVQSIQCLAPPNTSYGTARRSTRSKPKSDRFADMVDSACIEEKLPEPADDVFVESAPELEVHDSTQWTHDELNALKAAHAAVSPTRATFWAEVASRVQGRTEEECRSKWFDLFKTPVATKHPVKKYKGGRQTDDFFEATPFRRGSSPNDGSSLRQLDLGSAIKVDSDEVCDNMAARLSIESDDEEERHRPLSTFVPKATKAHVQNLKREMGKAVAAKKKQDKRNRNKPPRPTNISRMPQYFYSQDDNDLKAHYDKDGGVRVDMPDMDEDDFWDSIYEDGE